MINNFKPLFTEDPSINIELEQLGKNIVENSHISDFSEIIYMNMPVNQITFLDFDKNGFENGIQVLSLKPYTKNIEVQTYQVSCNVTHEHIHDLKNIWDIDILSMISNVLNNEASQSMCKQYLDKIHELSNKTYKNEYNVLDKILSTLYKTFKKSYEKTVKVKNLKELLSNVLGASNKILSNGRRGPANFIICNAKTGCYFQEMKGYVYESLKEIKQCGGNVYSIGSIANLKIYVDPMMNWNDNNIYIGRSGMAIEPGVKLFFYKVDSLSIIAEETMSPKVILKLRYAISEIGLKPETQYTKIFYKSKKKLR